MIQTAQIADIDTTKDEMVLISQKELTALLLCKSNEKQLLEQISNLKSEFVYVKYLFDQLKRLVYGTKSERHISSDAGAIQLSLFDVPEVTPITPKKEVVSYEREIKVKEKEKKKPFRQPLPDHLPRVEEIIEPKNKPENAREIGRVITEILEYKQASLFVRRIIRIKYLAEELVIRVNNTDDNTDGQQQELCSAIQAESAPIMDTLGTGSTTDTNAIVDEAKTAIIIAPMPSLPIPKSIAGAGLLAYICVSKFVDHLPFYRIINILKRDKITISESTMHGWYKEACRLLEPLYNVLCTQLLTSTYIQADESPLPVLDKDKPNATHQGYMWVYHDPLNKLVCFDYDKSRSGAVCRNFLNKWTGALQTDGYAGYNQFQGKEGFTLLACMAHARRKFEHAKDNQPSKSEKALSYFRVLYKIEEKARQEGMNHQQRFELRQKYAPSILTEFKEWLDSEQGILPKSAFGQAVTYTLGLWNKLNVYITDGKYEIDNNLIENSIRPLAIGRKNYLFAGNHDAAQRNAMMYSFFACCKKAGVNEFEWIHDVIERISEHKANKLVSLLPHMWKKGKEPLTPEL